MHFRRYGVISLHFLSKKDISPIPRRRKGTFFPARERIQAAAISYKLYAGGPIWGERGADGSAPSSVPARPATAFFVYSSRTLVTPGTSCIQRTIAWSRRVPVSKIV